MSTTVSSSDHASLTSISARSSIAVAAEVAVGKHALSANAQAIGNIPLSSRPPVILDAAYEPGELIYQLQLMFSDLKHVQNYASAQAAHNQSIKIENATRETFDALRRLMEQMDKLASQDVWDLIGAVVGVVFSAIFAGAAIAASGGALTAPVAVTMAVLIGAVIQMASTTSKHAGGPEFSLSKGMMDGIQAIAAQHMSKDDAQKLAMLLTGVIGTATVAPALVDPGVGGALLGGIAAQSGASQKIVTVLNMVGTLANGLVNAAISGKAMNVALQSAQAAGKSTTAASTMADGVKKVFTMQNGQIVSGATEGSLGIVQSKHGLEQAERQHDVDMTQAESTALRGHTDFLQAGFTTISSHQKTLAELLQEVLLELHEAKQGIEDSKTRMIRSLAPSTTTV